MSWDNNPYYNPENFGLVKVAEHELAEASYSFDILAVWKGEKGYYLATDSGCSCPTPFEDYNGLDDMTGPLTTEQVLEEAASLKRTHYEPNYDIDGWNTFLSEIRQSEVSA